MASRTHPHIDSPTDDELGRVVEGKKPTVREVYLEVHRLVLRTVPDVASSVDCVDGQIGYGARQFGYDGWGMAALAPFTNWVSLAFLRGARLEDPDRAARADRRRREAREDQVRGAAVADDRRHPALLSRPSGSGSDDADAPRSPVSRDA